MKPEPPFHYASLVEVAGLIQSRELSPLGLTEAMLARIDALDGELHSYLTVMADAALASAARAEAEIAAGQYRGPLHGIPVAVKDLCYTRGVPTTGGLAVRADFLPGYDATVVSRLQDAGAVLLGKLNLTEGAMTGYHPDFKIPRNPWHRDLAVGASSSGSGAATAAGLCYASLGSDTGGSIRFPSAANGLVGLKPTYGRVSRYGVLALAESLDHVGPMARYVQDAAASFDAIAGHDPRDVTSLADPLAAVLPQLDGDIRGMRIGFDARYAGEDVDPGLFAAIEEAREILASLGAEIVDLSLPAFGPDHFNLWIAICTYEALQAHRATFPERAEDYGAFFRGFLEVGAAIPRDMYEGAQSQRQAFSAAFQASLGGVDAVLCPAGHTPSRAADETGYGGMESLESADASPSFRFTFPADFAGTPTITLPCGAREDGAPYGMQLMGSRLGEAGLCRLAYAYERATPWHKRHPALDT